MKPSHISIAILLMSPFLVSSVCAQTPASGNQSGAAPTALAGEVPRLIKFSGTMHDAQGRSPTGPAGVTFALYSQQNGGAALWLETQNVKPDENGNYTILLGANSAHGVPAELFASAEARWLGIQVEQQPEKERILLVSVPYALKAKDAETLSGLPASAFVTTESLTSTTSYTAAAATSPNAPSTIASPALSSTLTAVGVKKAASPQQPGAACAAVISDGTAATNSISLFTAPCTIQSSLMTQALISGFLGVNLAGNNTGLLLNGTGTHEITMTGSTSSGRLGQDSNGFFFASDTNGKSVRFLTNNGTLNEWMRITSAGNVGIGTTAPAAKLDVNGGLNLPSTTSATVGVISLGGTRFAHNFSTTANGGNTFVGVGSGNFSMTGTSNTAVGSSALAADTTGIENAAFGFDALLNNKTGSLNAAFGTFALGVNTGGGNNSAFGFDALGLNTNGDNSAFGTDALTNTSTGQGNSAFGAFAFSNLGTGSGNIGVGLNAGANFMTNESNNIVIGSLGVTGQSSAIRIGDPSTQTAAFIAGIRGVTTVNANAIPVLIDSGGQLGTTSSSRRFKQDIHDMGDTTDTIMRLRPVRFRYKVHGPDGPEQYGLVAEEVAEVAPDLVARNRDGEIETVFYDKVNAILLNEVQKQERLIGEQQGTIARQQAEIQELAARLAKLEALITPKP